MEEQRKIVELQLRKWFPEKRNTCTQSHGNERKFLLVVFLLLCTESSWLQILSKKALFHPVFPYSNIIKFVVLLGQNITFFILILVLCLPASMGFQETTILFILILYLVLALSRQKVTEGHGTYHMLHTVHT